MGFQMPYKDQESGILFVDFSAYLNHIRVKKHKELRAQYPNCVLAGLTDSFAQLRKDALSFADIETWVLKHQETLAEGVCELEGKAFKPTKSTPYWSELTVLGIADAPTTSSEQTFSNFKIGSVNKVGCRLYNAMPYLGPEYFKNAGMDQVSSHFTCAYDAHMYAKDWSFIAARHLFVLMQHNRGIKKPYSPYSMRADLLDIDHYYMPRKSTITGLLETHFPGLSYDDFIMYEESHLFPDTVDAFCDVLTSFKGARLLDCPLSMPDSLAM